MLITRLDAIETKSNDKEKETAGTNKSFQEFPKQMEAKADNRAEEAAKRTEKQE